MRSRLQAIDWRWIIGLAGLLAMCAQPPSPSATATSPSPPPALSPAVAATATRQAYLPVVTRTASPTGLRFGAQTPNLGRVPLYQKFEVAFSVNGTAAAQPDFPYDPAPPSGLPGRTGLTVDGLFLPPGIDDWRRALVQPGFRYQAFERVIRGEAEGLSPVGGPTWVVRFAPAIAGTWRYKLRVQDASICAAGEVPCQAWVESTPQTFTAIAALPGTHGFIRVSAAAPRYFEFSDGTPFLGLGHQTSFGETTQVEATFNTYQANGVNLLRAWMSATGVYSLGFWFWDTWANSTLVFAPVYPGHDVAARIEGQGDSPCIFQGFGEGAKAAFKGGQTYYLNVRARLEGVQRPRVAGKPYGLVAKFGTWPKGICGQPDNGLITLSPYWTGSGDWTDYTATFTVPEDVILGGDGYFTLALENTDGGTAYVDEVRAAKTPDGPNVLVRGAMNYHLYFDPAASWRWDYILDRAAERGVFLKLVVLEKQDGILSYIRPDGTIASETSDANFYGVDPADPTRPTKVRRLQEYFWRYLSARWGYSTAVHSWELLNEGDPFDADHYNQAEAFGRVIHATDPNHHLVSTSFWHSFPVNEFWANPAYPDVDYADVHAYVDTTWLHAPTDIRDPQTRQLCGQDQACYLDALKDDSVLFHTEHSLNAWLRNPGKPVVRGEGALTLPGSVQETDPDLIRDVNGVWLHKFLFAQADPGGLYEIYWYTDEITANGLYPVFKRFRDFMSGIPFNSGQFVDAAPMITGAGLRALGQKDPAHARAFLWIDNRADTWKHVVDGAAIPPAGGAVTLDGFTPGATLPVEWWNTCSGQPPTACTVSVASRNSVRVDSAGRITLAIQNLATDVAVKIGTFPPATGP